MWAYLILLMMQNTIGQNSSVKTFNDFDTFTLTPKNTKSKNCPLKIECSYENDKLHSLIYCTVSDSILMEESVLHINGTNYFVQHGKKLWNDSRNGKTYKVEKLKYIAGENVRMIFFALMENKYKVIQVSELSPDNSYRILDYNYNGLTNYSSIEDFLKKDLAKLKATRVSTNEFVTVFHYKKDCKVGYKTIMLEKENNFKVPDLEAKSFSYQPSYGECIYLDCLRMQSYQDKYR